MSHMVYKIIYDKRDNSQMFITFKPDEDTLPPGILIPEFTGNACQVNPMDFPLSISRKVLWIGGFPRLERPSDQ